MEKPLAIYNAEKLTKRLGIAHFILLDDTDNSYFLATKDDMCRHPELDTYGIQDVIEP